MSCGGDTKPTTAPAPTVKNTPTKKLEKQMVDTITKIDLGLSKRFNPKLMPIKSKTKTKSI